MFLRHILCPRRGAGNAEWEACRRDHAVPVSALPACRAVCSSHHNSCDSSGSLALLCAGNNEAGGLTSHVFTSVNTHLASAQASASSGFCAVRRSLMSCAHQSCMSCKTPAFWLLEQLSNDNTCTSGNRWAGFISNVFPA